MKKKILICVHNYFALNNLFNTFKDIEELYDLTILTTNYKLTSREIKFKKVNSNYKIHFINFYNKHSKRDIFSIIRTHLNLFFLKKKINLNEFSLCISDGKFFIWQRIILEVLLNKKCIQVGLSLDATLLPLDRFKRLLDGENVNYLIKDIHKLREIKKKKLNRYNFFQKIINIYNRYLDILLDRWLLSFLFYRRNFLYNKNDFRLLENTFFDFKITFVKSSYLFWKNFYKNDVYIANLKNNCSCKNNINLKNKMLFLSSNFGSHNFFDKKKIDSEIEKLFKIFEKLLIENTKINKIDFRHHPEENNKIAKYINQKLSSFSKIKVDILDNGIPLENISCEYELAIGNLSGALFYLKKSCKNIKVYSYRSLNENTWGDYYFLKFIDEGIEFFDDTDKILKHEKNIYENKIEFNQYNLHQLIELFLKKKK